MSIASSAVVIALAFATPAPGQARGPSAADYERARRLVGPSLSGLVVGGRVSPTWSADGRFWYRNATPAGDEVIVIDPAKPSRIRCDANATTCGGVEITGDAGRDAGAARGGRGAGGQGPTSSYGTASNYMMRRRWDYFVKWLIGTDPPRPSAAATTGQ